MDFEGVLQYSNYNLSELVRGCTARWCYAYFLYYGYFVRFVAMRTIKKKP